MEIIEGKPSSQKKHKRSKIFMLMYTAWWIYFVYWFASGSYKYPHSCGAANGALIAYSLFFVAVFSLFLLIELFKCKKEDRVYYLLLLGLVWIPPLGVFLYLYTS
ncbi:MAG TPA: hypothetical protein VJY62_09960 [Bacteroidia bacterium]|nr:hypothetical protein [Bacteroidia bacterium]